MLTEEQVNKYSKIYNKLTSQIADYLINNNLKTMVLGISGGIDSTVCAALCNGAIKKANNKIALYGVMLPSVTNALVENESADAVMKAFCSTYTTVYIDDTVDALEDLCAYVTPEATKLAVGNIKARTRMIYLYHAAQMMKGLVISTDMMTEWMLGFFTKFGDEGDLCPMSDLWKHEVYELAEYIKDYICEPLGQKYAIGLSMALTPTDGNGVLSGGDMAQIAPGYTYNEVDKVLMYLYELENGGYRTFQSQTPEQRREAITRFCVNQCSSFMDNETVRKVVDRHYNTAFKRGESPVRLHI